LFGAFISLLLVATRTFHRVHICHSSKAKKSIDGLSERKKRGVLAHVFLPRFHSHQHFRYLRPIMANTKQPDLKEPGPSDYQLADFKKSHVTSTLSLRIEETRILVEIGTTDNWLWPTSRRTIDGDHRRSTWTVVAVGFSVHRRYSTIRS
jgi:hypothetical protein